MSLRHCLDFVRVIDTVHNRRPLALHGSVSAFFAHRVRKLLHISQNPAVSKLHLHLHSDSLSAQATPPHHQKTPVSLSTTLQHRTPAHHNSKGTKRPTLNHTSHSTTTARVCKHPTLEGKNSPGWWAGCGCMV